MSYATNARQYRSVEVTSATPGRLVVLLYDHLLTNIRKARMLAQGDRDRLAEPLGKARAIVAELMTTLDHEQGGKIADDLAAIYAFFLASLMEAGIRPDPDRLDALHRLASELRDSFAEAATQVEGEASRTGRVGRP